MGCLTDAIESGLSILDGLGERMESDPSKARVLVFYWSTKRVLSKKSDEALLRLPFMTNPTKLAAMHVLNLMILSALYAKPKLFAQIIFKMVRMTVKYGVCAASCVGFAYFGTILCGYVKLFVKFWHRNDFVIYIFPYPLNIRPFGDIDNGYRYAMLGKNMFKNLGSDEWKARVYLAFYGSVDSWREHVGNSMRPMEDAFETGLRTGDIEYAMVGKSNKNLMYALKDLPSHIFTS
jgi:predicted ATPase